MDEARVKFWQTQSQQNLQGQPDQPADFGVQKIADHAKPVEKVITGYHIIDKHTKDIVGKAKTLRAASRSVDRRDNAYGAYRYSHRPIYGDG